MRMSRTVFQFAANSYHMRTGNPTLNVNVQEKGRVLKATFYTFPLPRKSDEDLNNAMVFYLSRRDESMTMFKTQKLRQPFVIQYRTYFCKTEKPQLFLQT